MNWRLGKLDNVALVSFSDSHSYWPWRLGREATVFDLKEATYDNIIKAIRTREGLVETIEVNPSYGKYHWDGHRACNVCLSPKESIQNNNICPVCKKPLTIGVEHRVEELADRPEGHKPGGAKPFRSLVPLSEILSILLGASQPYSQKVWEQYNKLIGGFGSELGVLLDAPRERISKLAGERLADMIIKAREGKVTIKPGYDGVYGEPAFNGEQKRESKRPQKNVDRQMSLSDYKS
jgi:uncharacterized protein (TIGR00375 family)